MGGTYRSTSRPVHEPPATRRYHGFSPVPSDTRLYQVITVEISTVIARYKSISIDFHRRRMLLGDISLVATRLAAAREEARERRRTSDEENKASLSEENLKAMTYSPRSSPRLKRQEKEGSVSDFSSAGRRKRGFFSPRGEKETR
ncbi:hypothetical protein BHE74_00021915 [Ensete ventricosum]|nr:hypothetical protein GW17_00011187 [Ensete ventricosum]RWW70409.1 hypothetical protein BHE74_00021915 [Ensete ventricosum]RZS00532.1 hypothetical protein BHM03_00030239 [Ensete ventricosum]